MKITANGHWAIVFGFGFKVRVSERIYIHGEALLRYTGPDYLDDVSGNYRSNYDNSFQAYASNPSGRAGQERGNSPDNTDWFGQGLVSLHYSFGEKTQDARTSMIYVPSINDRYNLIKEDNQLLQQQQLLIKIRQHPRNKKLFQIVYWIINHTGARRSCMIFGLLNTIGLFS